MASPCEILIDTHNLSLARKLIEHAATEAFRIEKKYSRYRDDNIIYAINNAQGRSTAIDMETFQLLTFANTCYELSDGMFDLTSGVLRRVWKFDGSDNIPQQSAIEALMPYIGWDKISFDEQTIKMPLGFELDLGGIGKEYAVDCVAKICKEIAPAVSVLVNFGGDIQVTLPKSKGQYWQVGIEMPVQDLAEEGTKNSLSTQYQTVLVRIAQGGLATSGDANRYLMRDNVRYSHVLNPKTGKPISNAPRSVTVASEHCVQAGLMATLSLLQGDQAEQFLKEQSVTHWCYW
ncbi:FAD:protein FMN transferase [Glaciecola sp. MF2-115]|uniref:FAD:protein FMN transferase n=1 Tax=Glaciecola sp. MF2-115 TaxID=3384827 RepID=UPI0039A2A05B